MLLDEVRDAESVDFTYRKDLKKMSMRLKQQHNLYQVLKGPLIYLSDQSDLYNFSFIALHHL